MEKYSYIIIPNGTHNIIFVSAIYTYDLIKIILPEGRYKHRSRFYLFARQLFRSLYFVLIIPTINLNEFTFEIRYAWLNAQQTANRFI